MTWWSFRGLAQSAVEILPVTQALHALSFVLRIIVKQKEARNVTHTIILTNALRNYFCPRVILLGNQSRETSASWNYTLLGYTLELFWVIHLVRTTLKIADNYTKQISDFT